MSAQAAHESQLSIAVDSRQWPAGGSGGQGVDGPPPPPPPRPRQHERHVSLKLLVWTLVIHCLLSIITFFLPLLYLWPCLEQLLEEAVTRNFQQSVASVRTLALCNCWLVRLNRFLGYCVLTWASVIVLGGLIGNLDEFYFRRATVLIILQALQFGAAAAWRSFLPNRKLTLVLPRQKEATTSWVLHIIDYQRRVLLLKVEIPCIIMLLVFTSGSAFRPADLFDNLVHIDGSTRVVMKESLVVFSWLVFVSGLVAAAGILCGRLLFYFDISPCLGDFFDSIVRESMQSGLGGARKISVHATVFDMVSEEYRKQQRGTEDDAVYGLNEAVASQYGDMIAHVYHSDRGLETARMAIEYTNDACIQEAVVHMLGFWVDLENPGARAAAMETPPQAHADSRTELELADVDRSHKRPAFNRLRYEGALISRLLILALGNSAGRVTEAAIVSLEKLARNDPLAILIAEKNAAAMLAQRIIDLVDLGEGEPVRLIREPEHLQPRAKLFRKSLPGLIKVLIALLQSRAGDRRRLLTKKQSVELERRLLTAFQNPRCLKRLQVVAAYALHHTLRSQKFTCDILEAHLTAPAVQEDILLDEHDIIYLKYLKTVVPLQWPDATNCLRVIGQDKLDQSPRNRTFPTGRFSCLSTAVTFIFGIGTIPLMIIIARLF